jgi:ATP-dependent RNA helicase DeaD
MFPKEIHPALAQALSARGYTTLTPVQLAVLEPQAADRDLLVSAKTGSGKTVAYGLVLASSLIADDGRMAPPGAPSALVIAPTRELAMQVQRELQWLYADAKVVSCVGGMDPRAERRALDQGCQIVVGTPGRLRDHLERGQLRLEQLQAVILDEADEMLDLGFREELEEILDGAPKERRTLLFSATLPKPIVTMAAAYQKNALRLTVGAGEEAHSDIEYRAIRVAPSEVELATVNVLRFFESGAAIVFCSTREAVRKLHASLVERGFNAVALSGELTQNERTHALQALRDRRARVCVATDVAARGIDIPDLDLVIHAELPNNPDVLRHRSGRTGRAGRKGVCVILVPHPRRRKAELLLRSAKLEAAWQAAPTAEDIRAQDQTRLIEEVLPADQAPEEDMVTARELMEKRTPEDIAAAYVRLARTRMPAPEDLADAGPEPQPYGGRERGDRGDRPERGPYEQRPDVARPGFEDAVWFRIDFGRNKNAEPRWIMPMICRRGHVTKNEIGAIRIFERETRFQITGAMAEQFAAVAAKGGGDGGNIERLGDDAPPPPRDRNVSSSRHREMTGEGEPQARPPFKDRKPRGEQKPWEKAEGEDRFSKPRQERNDDFLRDEFKRDEAKAPDAPRSEFRKPDFKKPDFKKPDFKKPDFKKPDYKKPDFKQGNFKKPDFKKKDAFKGEGFKPKPQRPAGEQKPWTPPLDDGQAPAHAKALKAKKAKKRKANG